MAGENVLLLFSEKFPCWNHELVEKAGEDPAMLEHLEKEGLLAKSGICHFLTEKGREEFRNIAAEYYYDEEPAEMVDDPEKALLRCRLTQILDSSFVGRWGVKRFLPGQDLEYYPGLPTGEILNVTQKGEPSWIYENSAALYSIGESFPDNRDDDRALSFQEIQKWMAARNIIRDSIKMDLLFLHYCDFMYYMHKIPPQSDRLKLLHADRFFMQFARDSFYTDPPTLFEDIGKFHLFLFYYRHIVLPGNFDIDIHQQENLNALMYITRTEEEALRLYEMYQPMAEKLTGPAKPLDIWSLSLESMERHNGREDSHFDFFEKTGHRIAITYPG